MTEPSARRSGARGPLRRAGVGVLAVGALLLMAGPAAGQLLLPKPGTLSAGAATVVPCGDVSGITVSYEVRAEVVVAVALQGIPVACTGGQLSLTLSGGQGALASAGPFAVTGSTARLVIGSSGAVSTSVTDVHLVVVG